MTEQVIQNKTLKVPEELTYMGFQRHNPIFMDRITNMLRYKPSQVKNTFLIIQKAVNLLLTLGIKTIKITLKDKDYVKRKRSTEE